MQRPFGIFIAGTVLIVSGLLGLLVFSIGLLSVLPYAPMHTVMSPSMRAAALASEGVFAALSIFACIVAIALFRMRTWARYVSIVMAALGACFFALSAIMMLLMQTMPSLTPNAPAHTVHVLFMVMAAVYFVIAGISLFWVIYFNRQSVRAAFAAARAPRHGQDTDGNVIPTHPQQHPVFGLAEIVVWVAAVLFLVGGLSMVALLLLGMPIFLLGWNATGSAAFFIEVLLACLLLYAGFGLIRRWRTGWYLAVAMQLYSAVSFLLLLVPGYAQRLLAAGESLTMRLTPGAPINPISASFMIAGSAVGGLLALAILLALVRVRKSYRF